MSTKEAPARMSDRLERVMTRSFQAMTMIAALAACGTPSSEAAPEPAPAAASPVLPEAEESIENPQPEARTLEIQPLGDVPEKDLDLVRTSIEAIFGWSVDMLEPTKHPKSAWYKPRKRWRAEKILDWLAPRMGEGADRIMAVTKKDISTTKGEIYDWGICGLADMGGPSSLVSTYRIKKKMGKVTPEERKKKYKQRLRDLAAHEFGHTLDLPHCPTPGCIMADAQGTVLTFDESSGKLCDLCLERLDEAGFPMPSPLP
jgi:archaemetzincin